MAAIVLLTVLVLSSSALLVDASNVSVAATQVTTEPSICLQHQTRSIVIVVETDEFKTFPLDSFWSSTGFCPPEPRNAGGLFLLSKDNLLNLELIAALTSRAVKHVRIHWLLELLDVSLEDGSILYNFTKLDSFLDHLKYFGLHPAFELMGVPSGGQAMQAAHFWTDLVQQLVEHYFTRYGPEYVAEWRFEAWNEPDLKNYNMLNFSIDGYMTYVNAIRHGLDVTVEKHFSTLSNRFGPRPRLSLYGPAGLFKADEHHPLCWGIMRHCNTVANRCPFDAITFHRKGSGRWASEVLDGGRLLMAQIMSRYPNIHRFQFANDEADPIASWSTGRPFQADVRYAAMLFSIVAQHWDAMSNANDCFGQHMKFVSHDNAFLAYHPYEFEQRTLLARFQMNNTDPPHVQFVAKPVYSSLGMLANLGSLATRTQFREGNVSYIISFDEGSPPSYFCLLASRSNDSFPLSVSRTTFEVTISLNMFLNRPLNADSKTSSGVRISYLIEALQDGMNDPFRVWQWLGRPAYPSTSQLAAMRAVQFPTVLNNGGTAEMIQLGGNRTSLELRLNLRGPWIVSVRICRNATSVGKVRRLRVRTVFKNDVLIFWAAPKSQNVRCIQNYEVWFKPLRFAVDREECQWGPINTDQHTPFTFFQFVGNISTESATDIDCSGVNGFYKVRAIDMFHQPAPFSSAVLYVTNSTV